MNNSSVTKGIEIKEKFDQFYSSGHSTGKVSITSEVEDIRIVSSRAEGARIWDVNEKECLDYVCAYGPNILGHRHPEYIESIVLENIYRDYCSIPKSLRSRGVAPDPPSAHPSKFNKIPWETLKNGCAKTLDKKQVSPVDLTNVTSCRGSKFIVLKDKDIQGYDLSTVSSNIFENCCFHCSNSSNCFSFTFVDGTCRLKKLNVLKIDQNNQNKVFTTKVGVLSALTAELS